MDEKKEKIIAVAGPTASGKTSLAVSLALRFSGEIISCDSMQLYRGMDIGTAKVTPDESRGIAHWLTDVFDITESFSVSDYVSLAEDAVKARVQKAVSRGKVDVYITVDASAADVAQVNVNTALAAQYAQALRALAAVCGTEGQVTPEQLARFPEVLTVTKADEDLECVSADLCAVLDEALDSYNAMRAAEGVKLAEDIGARLTAIEGMTAQVEERSPETVREYRQKLTARMQEVLQSTAIDEQRILQEAAIYADRIAVDEETVRLRSHVSQLRGMLQSDQPMGRKMDFLIQELNRESNTIGSKCSNLDIARIVVDLKGEVEKIREQVQNIE